MLSQHRILHEPRLAILELQQQRRGGPAGRGALGGAALFGEPHWAFACGRESSGAPVCWVQVDDGGVLGGNMGDRLLHRLRTLRAHFFVHPQGRFYCRCDLLSASLSLSIPLSFKCGVGSRVVVMLLSHECDQPAIPPRGNLYSVVLDRLRFAIGQSQKDRPVSPICR